MKVTNAVRLQQNLLVHSQRPNLALPGERPEENHVFFHQFGQGEQIGARHDQTLLPRAEELAEQQRRGRRAHPRVTERRAAPWGHAALLLMRRCPWISEHPPSR